MSTEEENKKGNNVNSGSSANEDKQVKEDIKNIPSTIWKYIISVFSFSNNKDSGKLEVIEDIKSDIEFKGPNVWILICSIVICSIGLHLNSIPVIVGAMLISPLMGPIRGIGLAVGTNDFKLLIYSLMNFGVATVVSIVASYLYFKIMPFKDVTPEIDARIQPLILDVLVAFFGGLAGIIAASRKNVSTVVPGVAIATALMPPLCVAGFGLATGKWNYFFGSSYLFVLNSVFICLATIIVVRYLRFPLATYINKRKERNIKIYIAIFLLLILVPSGMKFMEVFNKSVFKNTASSFVKEHVTPIPGIKIFDEDYNFESNTITLFLAGRDFIPASRREELQNILKGEKYGLTDCSLVIVQNEDMENNGLTMDDFRLMSKDWEEKIIERDKKIKQLEADYKNKTDFNYDITSIDKKLKLVSEFNKIESFTTSKAYRVDMNGKMDTTILIVVEWLDSNLIPSRTSKLNEWIEVNFETNNYQVIEKTK